MGWIERQKTKRIDSWASLGKPDLVGLSAVQDETRDVGRGVQESGKMNSTICRFRSGLIRRGKMISTTSFPEE